MWGYPRPSATFLRGPYHGFHPTASTGVCPANRARLGGCWGPKDVEFGSLGWKRPGRTGFDLNQFVGQARNSKLQD